MQAWRHTVSLEVNLRALRGMVMFLPGQGQSHGGVLAYAAVLEGVKVSPKVDLLLLAPADEGVKVGPRDKVLCLSLDFQVVRMLSFSSTRSASVALKSSSESRHRASLNTP